MRRLLKKTGIGLIIVAAGIQFIPADYNYSEEAMPTDITLVYPVPDTVLNILRNSCFDCHSNKTNYPWYSRIQPARLLMDYHVKEGKAELNLSEFGSYSRRRQKNKLKSMVSQLEDEQMPLSSYTLMHREARLTEEDKTILIAYLDSLIAHL
ncbi:MAG: heme-binding domain-containing protein [Bacteroidia bacterium]